MAEQTDPFQALLTDKKLASTALQDLGKLPTTQHEDWKYTRLARLAQVDWQLPKLDQVWEKPEKTSLFSKYIIWFVDGQLREANLPDTVQLHKRQGGLQLDFSFEKHFAPYFFELQRLSSQEHWELIINASLDQPLQIHYLQTQSHVVSQQAVKVRITADAQAQIIQCFSTKQEEIKAFTNYSIFAHLSTNAKLTCDFIQLESPLAFHISNQYFLQERDSQLTLNTFSLQAQILRNNVHIAAVDSGTSTNLNGVFLPRGQQLFDNHIALEHRAPHQVSNQLYKGILQDSAHGVFNGRIKIFPNAQKIQGFQSNKNILLSDKAVVDTKPELEIYANDVRCSHGTTTGEIVPQALFYLQSRGLSHKEAYQLLLQAFVQDCIGAVEGSDLQDYIRERILERWL